VDAPDRIVLGSRGSELALAQARLVEEALRREWPELEIALEIIRTSGDESSAPMVDRKAGRKGMFTREIEKALLAKRIDVAVHSAKDLPSERLAKLELRAALPRAQTEDVLVTKAADTCLTTLPAGATVATGSVRRRHQLRSLRPDLKIADIRGNVPTRLRKLRESETWSGIILARAGLDRLGMEVVERALRLPSSDEDPGQAQHPPYNIEILSPEDFVPAGGQGVIALQIRRDDADTSRLLEPINDRPTLLALRAEREFLRLLEGDCDSPVGVQGSMAGEELILRAQVFEPGKTLPKVGKVNGAKDYPEVVAGALMELIYGR
jgi:hydroxymethylbilane synthase